MRQKNRVRLIYVATAVAILGMAGGYVMASVLTTTSVNQGANFYQGGNTGANGYSTATLAVTTVPASVSACTSSTVTGATSAGTSTAVLSSTTGGTVCTTGDFAEEYTFTFSATIATQSNTITVTTQVASGTIQTNTATFTLGTGSAGAFTQTVQVYVDYGSVSPPAGGITLLDAVIQ